MIPAKSGVSGPGSLGRVLYPTCACLCCLQAHGCLCSAPSDQGSLGGRSTQSWVYPGPRLRVEDRGRTAERGACRQSLGVSNTAADIDATGSGRVGPWEPRIEANDRTWCLLYDDGRGVSGVAHPSLEGTLSYATSGSPDDGPRPSAERLSEVLRWRPIDVLAVNDNDVRGFVHHWYAAFERLRPAEFFLEHFDTNFVFGDSRTAEEFRSWYAEWRAHCPWDHHEVLDLAVAGSFGMGWRVRRAAPPCRRAV